MRRRQVDSPRRRTGICLRNSISAGYYKGKAFRRIMRKRPSGIAAPQNRDSPKRKYNLGSLYDKGEGVPQDYAEAAKWFRRAAEQGNAIAQNNLGMLYYEGNGVPQDYAEAVKWFRRAAEQGDANAQFNLGVMHSNGKGVPQNYWEACVWFALAAANGHQQALEYMSEDAQWLSPAELSSAREEATRRRAIQGETATNPFCIFIMKAQLHN